MKKLKWIVLVSIVILICGYIILERNPFHSTIKTRNAMPHRDLQPELVWNGNDKLSQTYPMMAHKDLPKNRDWGQVFKESKNQWAYAHSILASARNGDSNAQYYLFKSIDFCNENLRFYFTKKGRSLTFDEGLQYAVQRSLSLEIAQTVYEKCHEYSEHDLSELGNSSEWLAKASKAGQPLAQAVTASRLLSQLQQQAFVNAGAVPVLNHAEPIESILSAQELFRTAVESKDPEVLFSIGEAQSLLNPGSPTTDVDRYAWWLVACQRGFDCTAQSDWVKASCIDLPSCASANNSSELVRSLAGDQWADVQERAKQIDAKLNAGQWSELGLGS